MYYSTKAGGGGWGSRLPSPPHTKNVDWEVAEAHPAASLPSPDKLEN